MPTVIVDTTLVERPTVYGNTSGYRVAEVIMANVAHLISGGAGQSITIPVEFSAENLPESLDYCIQGMASQACSMSYDNKTSSGFDVILTPKNSGIVLSAGTVDLKVTWSVEV